MLTENLVYNYAGLSKVDEDILLIIDMQVGFYTSAYKQLQDEIVRQIAKAKKNDALIINLKYTVYGALRPRLQKALRNYSKKVTIWKNDDDGSRFIQGALLSLNINPKSFTVCGINTSYCVKETIEGLLEKYEKAEIKVVEGGCNCLVEVSPCSVLSRQLENNGNLMVV